MDAQTTSTRTDNKLLLLGILSFLLFPFTALPGIVIGRRQQALSARGRVGYILCWVCLVIFSIHLLLLGVLIMQHS